MSGFVRQFLRAEEEAGEGSDHDQKWKQRHQRGQCNVARDRPTVVRDEMPKSVGCQLH